MTEPQSSPNGAGPVLARLARVLELALAEVPLSLPQYRLMSRLATGWTGTTRLASDLSVSRPNVSILLNGLVEAGLADRRGNPEDRRQVHCSLNRRGRKVLAEADAAVERRLADLLGHLDEDGQRLADLHVGPSVALWEEALDAARTARRVARASERAAQRRASDQPPAEPDPAR